jgi:hypothetical protein
LKAGKTAQLTLSGGTQGNDQNRGFLVPIRPINKGIQPSEDTTSKVIIRMGHQNGSPERAFYSDRADRSRAFSEAGAGLQRRQFFKSDGRGLVALSG